jgi:SAM-dependent methyltransferase
MTSDDLLSIEITCDELDRLYQNNFGISRSSLNADFLSGLSAMSTILEVGCNRGLHLEFLMNQGYNHLYGFDVSSYAIDLLVSRIRPPNIARASALSFQECTV